MDVIATHELYVLQMFYSCLLPCSYADFLLLFFQRFYHHLELKSKHPDAAVPPLDESLKRITEPDSEVISKNKFVIDEFRRHFELKENPKVKQIRPLFISVLFDKKIIKLTIRVSFSAKEID